MLRGFPPVVAECTHTLILGSFPGEASLVATQYYAHPRNQFWRLLGAVIGEPLHELDYPKAVSMWQSATRRQTTSLRFASTRRS